MSSLVVLIWLLLAGQAAAQSPVSPLDGVWEGHRKRVPLGDCRSTGPARVTVTFWTEPDQSLRGRFTRASGAPGEFDLTAAMKGGKVAVTAPRVADCGGNTRRYTVTLEGTVGTDASGHRVLTLSGVDQTCPAMACSFRDEYALTWMRTAPGPAAR